METANHFRKQDKVAYLHDNYFDFNSQLKIIILTEVKCKAELFVSTIPIVVVKVSTNRLNWIKLIRPFSKKEISYENTAYNTV